MATTAVLMEHGPHGLVEPVAVSASAASTGPRFFHDTGAIGSSWFVVHTHARQEKALAETLDARGVRYFLPLVRGVKYYGHRRRVVERPLFASYVFLWGSLEQTYLATSTKRVARVLPVPDQVRLEYELAQIRAALAGAAELDPYPYLAVGRRARVTSGPLRGVEGIIRARLAETRLVLGIQTLGQAVSVEIDPSLLEPVD